MSRRSEAQATDDTVRYLVRRNNLVGGLRAARYHRDTAKSEGMEAYWQATVDHHEAQIAKLDKEARA
jgi:hypothetical protein